ncbi:hypothetical protein A5646_03450 [Mycobacterium sp. 1245499.0]|uniref:hypothetical protein n=1 Tax=Mycobacterium sp. 1245499.0 TaxID=1834074 RepID=UPI0008021AC4|nr:hypothetical protein [Mycobacterium sp. 1245499.0]OBK92371.1 hypothetical protein A5646_03450 [Mycobacterium sp. 1245499.0]
MTDICDAIDEAEDLDAATELEQARALVNDIDIAGEQLQQDFKYPVDAHGRVMFVNQLHPDLMPCLVYHLIRCGWRKDNSKRMVKQRKVVGTPFADLVAYVPLTDPDEPIVAPQPEKPKTWSVRPQINEINEKRPD